MIRVRDSFLHFLNDNLPDGLTLHPLRRDPSNRAADALAMNAINISFLNLTAGNDTALASQQVVIDVIADDENTVVDWVGEVFDLLRTTFYVPLYDYSNPSTPVATGTNLMWDRRRVTFKKITSEAYSHYSCQLSLKFTSP